MQQAAQHQLAEASDRCDKAVAAAAELATQLQEIQEHTSSSEAALCSELRLAQAAEHDLRDKLQQVHTAVFRRLQLWSHTRNCPTDVWLQLSSSWHVCRPKMRQKRQYKPGTIGTMPCCMSA
jgi:hypothetical protein